MTGQPERAIPPTTQAVYRLAFPGDAGESTLAERRRDLIDERLGLLPPYEQGSTALVEGLKPLGFDGSMLRLLIREKTLAEIALFAEYAVATFGADLHRANAVPKGLRPKPGLGDGFNRALAAMAADKAAIDRAIARLTGRKPPGRDR